MIAFISDFSGGKPLFIEGRSRYLLYFFDGRRSPIQRIPPAVECTLLVSMLGSILFEILLNDRLPCAIFSHVAVLLVSKSLCQMVQQEIIAAGIAGFG